MRIAIIGAGFCGLALTWHLLQQNSNYEIVLFDAKGIGTGASGIATGLLHPYGGAHAKLNRMGIEGITATLELVKVAENALGKSIANDKGILRLALTSEQENDFLLTHQKYSNVQWYSKETCHQLYPYLSEASGIWINGKIIHAKPYLEGLWKACQNKGATYKNEKIENLEDLRNFDRIIISAGADSLHFQEVKKYALSIVKGQILEMEWPKELPPIPFALNSHAYLLMNENGKSFFAGATYERGYTSIEPDVSIAKRDIIPKVISMIPSLEKAKIINCYAGLRVVTPTHMPLIEKINERTWIFTGMGSKGLLYHAWAAKSLTTIFN